MMPPDRLWRELRPGDVVLGTKYVVVRKLGQGAQAEVYEAKHSYLEKFVVIKLWCASAMTEESFRDFRREAIKQAAMAHDNIVTVVDGDMTEESPPRPYFIMEHHKGQMLDHALRKMRAKEALLKDAHLDKIAKGQPSSYVPQWLSVRRAAELCIQLCDALTHAHVEHGIIHRDLKPANVFLKKVAWDLTQPKLVDFGIFKVIEEAVRTQEDSFYGTLTHCGPEQLRGNAYPQSDLYALTGILYELLTGVRCFPDAVGVPALLRCVIHEMPLPPSKRMKNVSPRLDAFVMKNLSKNYEQRSPSAREYAKELAIILDEYRAQAGEPQSLTPGDDAPTDRMPLADVMEIEQEDEESVMRAKATSYWDSQRGVTVSVAMDGEEEPSGPRIFHARPVDQDPSPPPPPVAPAPEQAPNVPDVPRAPQAEGQRSAATLPHGGAEIAGFAQSVTREREARAMAEAAARAAAAHGGRIERGRLVVPASPSPKLGDTDPSRIEPLPPAPIVPRSAVPHSVPIVEMNHENGKNKSGGGTDPMSAPPMTSPMTPESHQSAADMWRAAVISKGAVASASTLPMPGAPGRVPAPAKVQNAQSTTNGAQLTAVSDATEQTMTTSQVLTIVAGGFAVVVAIVLWWYGWLGAPRSSAATEVTDVPMPTMPMPQAESPPSTSSAAEPAPVVPSDAGASADAAHGSKPKPKLKLSAPPATKGVGPVAKPRRGESPNVGP